MDNTEPLVKRFRDGRIVCDRHRRHIEQRRRLYYEMKKLHEQNIIWGKLKNG